jgi:hypothetical protein
MARRNGSRVLEEKERGWRESRRSESDHVKHERRMENLALRKELVPTPGYKIGDAARGM